MMQNNWRGKPTRLDGGLTCHHKTQEKNKYHGEKWGETFYPCMVPIQGGPLAHMILKGSATRGHWDRSPVHKNKQWTSSDNTNCNNNKKDRHNQLLTRMIGIQNPNMNYHRNIVLINSCSSFSNSSFIVWKAAEKHLRSAPYPLEDCFGALIQVSITGDWDFSCWASVGLLCHCAFLEHQTRN